MAGSARSQGDAAVVVERRRPIDLRHHFAVHRRGDDETLLMPLLEPNGKPAGEGLHVDQACRRALSVRPRPVARGPAPAALPRSPAHRDDRGAGRPRHAPGHRLHLQPRRLRPTRCARCSATACASPTPTSAPPSAGSPSAASNHSRTTTCGSSGTTSGSRGSSNPGGAPRRAGAPVPRDGGGVLRRRAAQGHLRHRDALAGHQHAGPVGRHRTLHQVRRVGAGHAHLGEYLPAHRARRAAAASTTRVTRWWPGRTRCPSPRRRR